MVWIGNIEILTEEELEEYIRKFSPKRKVELQQLLKLLYELGAR